MAGKLEDQLKKKRGFASAQQAVVVGMLRTNDMFQYRFGQLFRSFELTQPQYNVLTILRGEGKPLPILEIRERLVARTAAITGLVDKLVRGGLVDREQCSDDRRVWYVSLTEAGQELVARMDDSVMKLHKDLCRGLSTTECKQLAELMERAREGAASEDKPSVRVQ
ncbi:MAG: MarR family transcriptional regulator [Planctomycetota bacterium]